MTITARAGQLTHGGIRLRAAANPIGNASTMPSAVASTAICRLSSSPLTSSSQREKLGGNRREKKRPALSMPISTRSHEISICAQA